ncbi:XRE family transcriptional regulator [Snodgrassella communis]|uniref:XRE family transcriptional regulator n=1 Tax=Snodgrassella communis TaxID=2946699 RepID=UPI001EF464AD|nr:helix-turn-helix transcriptional regulator [Snodgrassella communis]
MTNFYDDKMIFAQRISEVVEILGNPNTAAKKAGVTASSVGRWLRGESDPSRTNLVRLAEAANVNIAWLATGEGEKFRGAERETSSNRLSQDVLDVFGRPVDVNEFVFIPRYNVKAAAGDGYYNSNENSTLVFAFRKYWIKNYLQADPKHLSVIAVKGDSMEGVLNDGDNILVNHANNKPGSGLYVVRIGEDLIVKRVQSLPGGRLLITSANEAYAPFEVDISAPASDVSIIGRVEWFGRYI